MVSLNKQRLALVESTILQQYNSHYPAQDCLFRGNVMEAVAFVAGEPWTDQPACACPVITQAMSTWDCWLPQSQDRDRLFKPLIPRIVGTRSTAMAQEYRSRMAADWLLRELAPAWLHAARLDEHAKTFQALPDLTEASIPDSLTSALHAVNQQVDAAVQRLIQDSKNNLCPLAGRLVYAAAASWAGVVGSESANAAAVDAMCDAAKWSSFEEACHLTKSVVHHAATSIAWVAAWEEACDVIAPDSNPLELSEVGSEDDRLAAEVRSFEEFKETVLMACARSASKAAARTSLKPLVAGWQASASSLVERMCAV